MTGGLAGIAPDFAEIWTYLSRDPLLWLTATLCAYAAGEALSRAAGRNPLVNPVLIAALLLAAALVLTATPYETYFEGAQFVHFMLGPATVALAVPLRDNLRLLRRSLAPLAAALLAGSATAVASALAIASALGIERATLLSLAPKSATAPVAMGVAERMGGSPTLTAALVILTGVIGAIAAPPLLDLMGVRDPRARGFSIGVAAHGIGTARAFQESGTAGAFSGVGMGLNALLTAVLAPLIASLML